MEMQVKVDVIEKKKGKETWNIRQIVLERIS